MEKTNVKYLALIVLFTYTLVACYNKKVLSPGAYVEWINSPESPLNSKKEIGEYTVVVKYLPHDFLALKETKNKKGEIDAKSFEINKNNYAGHNYFLLRIEGQDNNSSALRGNIDGYNEYSGRTQYFSFDAQDDFKVVQGNDTIDCALHHFENNYGISPINDVMLVFKDKGTNDDLTFIWNDRVLGIGTVKFNFKGADIDNIPTLKIN